MFEEKKERKYDKFVKEISFPDFKELVDSGKINKNADYGEVFCYNLIPQEIDDMVDSFMEMMDDGGAYIGVELKPEEMCTEAYAVKNHLEIFDMVFVLNKNRVLKNKIYETFECDGSMDSYTLANYIDKEAGESKDYKKEVVDALGWGKQQEHVDEIEKKYAAGEISIFDVYREFNWADDESLDEQKVKDLLAEVDKIDFDEMLEKIKDFTTQEFEIFSELLKKDHPEVQEKFNKQVEDKEEQAKKEYEEAKKKAEERKKYLEEVKWHYNVVADFDGKKLAVRLRPEGELDGEFNDDIPESILEPFLLLDIKQKYSNDTYVYFDEYNVRTMIALPREIIYDLSRNEKYIYDANLELTVNPDFVDIYE